MSTKRLIPFRNDDLYHILDLLADGQCVAVVGVSNYGKSNLLRGLHSAAVRQHFDAQTDVSTLFIYVDCNRMLELSPRGFYETILRATLESLPPDNETLRAQIEEQYQTVVSAPGDFTAPLAFNDALIALVENGERRLVLLFDEFDQILTSIEARVLLNLRALRDRYGMSLNYVLGSVTPPSQARRDEQFAEFVEMFAAGKHYLGPLTVGDTRRMAAELFTAADDALDEPEGDFVVAQAGGHPGLIHAVCRVLLDVESGAPQLYQQQAFSLASAALEHDSLLGTELARLWGQLTEREQQAAIDLSMGHCSADQKRWLTQRGLLRETEEQGDPQLFGELFARFARRQALTRREMPRGVWVDTDSGEVWVDGVTAPTLTDLEYRLLLLLYGRLDKICDKYQLVEAVWGEDYLDRVDDARIEKLVSRLRGKLEDHTGASRYLVTVRGRGYKLASHPQTAS